MHRSFSEKDRRKRMVMTHSGSKAAGGAMHLIPDSLPRGDYQRGRRDPKQNAWWST